MSVDAAHPTPHIGVLAMQGAFAEHVRALVASGATAVQVRTPAELDAVDAIVIPGGESTAIRKALDRCGLLEPLRSRIERGMPAFGTCAGLIVLADAPADGAPPCLGLLDVDVERNGFGGQVHSFEGRVRLGDDGGRCGTGVFIRAPRITRIGHGVAVVGRLDAAVDAGAVDGEPVVVRGGRLLGATYHPELTTDLALHTMFVEMVVRAAADDALAD